MNKKNLIICGIIAPLFYITLITLLGALLEDYNPLSQFISEMGSVNSPFKNFTNLVFMIFGVLTVLFAIALKKEFKNNVSYFFLLIAGVFKFLAGVFPCDNLCINISLIGKLHTLTSNVFSISLPFAALFLVPSLKKNKKIAYTSFILATSSLIAGILMVIPSFSQYTGLFQRIKIELPLIWMFILAIYLYKKNY
jgi:hypothetical membrane protein